MNPAQVPNLVGASPTSIIKECLPKRGHSSDAENRSWVRCGSATSNKILLSPVRHPL